MKTGRNHAANVATFRNSAGSMKDKRAPREGARNDQREIMESLETDELGFENDSDEE